MTLLLFLKRTSETDRTANKGRQVDSSLVCFRSQALELTGFGIDNAVLTASSTKNRQGRTAIPITVFRSECCYLLRYKCQAYNFSIARNYALRFHSKFRKTGAQPLENQLLCD